MTYAFVAIFLMEPSMEYATPDKKSIRRREVSLFVLSRLRTTVHLFSKWSAIWDTLSKVWGRTTCIWMLLPDRPIPPAALCIG